MLFRNRVIILAMKNNKIIINFSWFINKTRPYLRNSSDSIYNIMEDFFSSFYSAYKLDESVAYKIINNKINLPAEFLKLVFYKKEEEFTSSVRYFFDNYLDENGKQNYFESIKKDVSESNLKNKDLLFGKKDFYDYMSLFLKEIFKIDNRVKQEKIIKAQGDNYIKAISGDLISLAFNKKGNKHKKIYVISVDSQIGTIQSENYRNKAISPDSIHGEWLSKLNSYGKSSQNINDEIFFDSEFGIGVFDMGITEFYLLPIADIKDNGKTFSNKDRIESAITKLVEKYDAQGQGVEIYVPLIGTGRSGFNLSLKESFDLLVDSFSKEMHGKINIVVYEKDVDFWRLIQ